MDFSLNLAEHHSPTVNLIYVCLLLFFRSLDNIIKKNSDKTKKYR